MKSTTLMWFRVPGKEGTCESSVGALSQSHPYALEHEKNLSAVSGPFSNISQGLPSVRPARGMVLKTGLGMAVSF